MVSMKALGAIALTMMIVVPICLGYAMALSEEETSSYETTDQYNVGDMMLNNSSDYFSTYRGSMNNGGLFNPDYVSVSSTYSSMPTYTSTTSTWTPASSSSTSWTISSGQVIGLNITGATYTLTAADEMVLTATSGRLLITVDSGSQGYSTQMYSGDSFTLWRTGESSWFNYELGDVVTIRITGSGALAETYRSYAAVSTSGSFTASAITGSCQIVTSDATDYKIGSNGTLSISYASATKIAVVNGYTYQNISAIKLVSDSSVTIEKRVETGLYADTAQGWTVPSGGMIWSNGQINESATFSLYLPDGSSATFTALGNTGTISVIELDSDSGSVSAKFSGSTYTVGTYTYLQLQVTSDGFTVSGITGWPDMGTSATVLNSMTFARDTGTFTQALIYADDDVEMRCDIASVKAGTFPSTKDYTLDMDGLVDSSWSVKINSVGVYGDTLRLGTTVYTVDQGQITIDGDKVAVKGLTLTAFEEEDGWRFMAGGHELGTGLSASPTVEFGGEWSLTATGWKVAEVTGTELAWHAGEFGFDKETFAAAGLITAGALLVILGMTGQRSTAKMGLLLLICGGAAVGYIMLI